MNKPPWLNKKIRLNDCVQTEGLLRDLQVRTVCKEALCPNISECFSAGQATFLILGEICTRNCGFCAVRKGQARPLNPHEPERVSRAVKELGLRHVVITSVTRDDLPDGGAGVFAGTIRAIREARPLTGIEVLIPDFRADPDALMQVIDARPDIIAHNLETVPRLYPTVRKGANYKRSLEVLRFIKQQSSRCKTKSGLMLGLGEHDEEVKAALRDLRTVQVDFLTLGQYLAPGHAHLPVKEYIPLEKFESHRAFGARLGFEYVMSGPYVRSSYLAESYSKPSAASVT